MAVEEFPHRRIRLNFEFGDLDRGRLQPHANHRKLPGCDELAECYYSVHCDRRRHGRKYISLQRQPKPVRLYLADTERTSSGRLLHATATAGRPQAATQNEQAPAQVVGLTAPGFSQPGAFLYA